jgi:hypothetical protein
MKKQKSIWFNGFNFNLDSNEAKVSNDRIGSGPGLLVS